MEIITAGDGTAHVSSADDGTIYAGIAGNECYVTGVGDKLSCTMQGANTALVGTGVGIMYGRAFRVAMPEEVTIQSGTQSQRRNDVICAHFVTSSEGHESGELVVLKGTPTPGQEAKDPEIPSGDILEGATEAYMPLWRIPLDGINVGEPESMFGVLMPMSELQGEIAELRDSVSRFVFGVEDITIPQGQVSARIIVETPFEPRGCVASPRGAVPGYSVSTQESGSVEEIVMFRTGSTASSVTRSVAYMVWG